MSGPNISLFVWKYSSPYFFLFFSIILNSSLIQFSLMGILLMPETFLKKRYLCYWRHAQRFLNTLRCFLWILAKLHLVNHLQNHVSFGSNGVNLSERCYFLSLARYFNNLNVYGLQSLLKFHLLILFELVLQLVLCHSLLLLSRTSVDNNKINFFKHVNFLILKESRQMKILFFN